MQPLLRLIAVCATFWVVLSIGRSLSGQEIVGAQWGFDGQVRTATYNLLTVEVRNPTSDPWEDALVLSRSAGVARVGLPHSVPVFLAPGQVRRVQFAVYVANETDAWSLRWEVGQLQGFDVPMARQGQAGFVLLERDGSLQAPIKNLRTFRVDSWPTTVAVTDSLEDVVVDHVPDLDGPRRQVFLDWLAKGGRLHVLLDPGGRRLRFGDGFEGFDAMAEESNPAWERLRYGAGEIYRYPLTRGMIDKGGFRRKGLEFNQLETRERDDQDIRDEAYRPDELLKDSLRQRVQPEHAWELIFLLALGFVVLVGPVHWWLVRRREVLGPRPATRRRYARGVSVDDGEQEYGEVLGSRWSPTGVGRLSGSLGWVGSIVYLVAVVMLFTWLFLRVGARGYGESTRLDTVAVAEALGGGRWDVDAISNLFVTDGDRYRVDVPGDQGVVSAGPVREPVRGRAIQGRDAHLLLDVPLFSSRPYVRRSVVSLDGPVVTTSGSWNQGVPIGRVDNWPVASEYACWIYDNAVWEVNSALAPGAVESLSNIVRSVLDRQAELASQWGDARAAPPRLMGLSLALERLGLLSKEARQAFRASRTAVLVVIAPLPDPARVSGLDMTEAGYITYIVRVPAPPRQK